MCAPGAGCTLDLVTNTLSSFLYFGFVHLFGRSVDRGEYEDLVARQRHPLIKKRVVAGRRTGLIVLARSCSLVHGVGNVRIPVVRSAVYSPLTSNPWDLIFLVSIFPFPDYRPLLTGSESHFRPPNEEVNKVLSV